MATLYYTAGSCGAASYIAAKIAGIVGTPKLTAHKVDIQTHKITSTGADFYAVNPKGNVPTLTLADGTLLNEGAATLQWIADQAPESGLAPAYGTSGRYTLINSLNYLASELHASFGPLFNPAITEEGRAAAVAKLHTKLKYVNEGGLPQTKADAPIDVAALYLYIILTWAGYVKVDLSAYTNLTAFSARIAAHPTVAAAHKEMNEAA